MTIPASIIFAGFVCWLLSFAMDGTLLVKSGWDSLILFFLVPHVVTLYFLSLFSIRFTYDLKMLADAGIVLAGLSTLFFPYSDDYGFVFVVLCGIGAAPLLMRLGSVISRSNSRMRDILAGLIAGNFLTLVLTIIPVGIWSYVLAVVCVSLSFGRSAAFEEGTLKPVLIYQPLIFILYTMSGVMYGFLMPGYMLGTPAPGIELVFYVLAVLLGWYFFSQDLKGLLYLAIAMAILSQPALYGLSDFFFKTGIFCMQSSMGFADFFVLAMAITQRAPAKSLGLSSATLCTGIIAGLVVSSLHFEAVTLVALLGNIALAFCIILLMVTLESRSKQKELKAAASTGVEGGEDSVRLLLDQAETEDECLHLSERVTENLSPREEEVLRLVVSQGKLYREVAEELGISESTVKTYMKRIYIKTGVSSKKDLDDICHAGK